MTVVKHLLKSKGALPKGGNGYEYFYGGTNGETFFVGEKKYCLD